MTDRSLTLEILSPEKRLYKGNVVLVQLPGTLGSFEILFNHAPLISTIEKGTIKFIDTERNKLNFDVQGGVVEVKKNKIVILVH
ncbi:MAG TPA: ATP synthase F1 subunit epsilon [Bacteroidales bacterium]|nr:ATP synthase F1 subunit epsilon [Bacteroidales bacterium]